MPRLTRMSDEQITKLEQLAPREAALALRRVLSLDSQARCTWCLQVFTVPAGQLPLGRKVVGCPYCDGVAEIEDRS